MKKKSQYLFTMFTLTILILLPGCAPQATPTPVDTIGTIAAQLASQMLTQTAAAYSPTPLPVTDTPIPTSTETLVPFPIITNIPRVVGQTPCYTGPGPAYSLTSNITDTKKVELVGIGSVSGWYLIKNPYFGSICWVSADHLQFDPTSDFSNLPVMTP